MYFVLFCCKCQLCMCHFGDQTAWIFVQKRPSKQPNRKTKMQVNRAMRKDHKNTVQIIFSNVKNVEWMFSSASSFNGDSSCWDVSKTTDMTCMFPCAACFNQEGLSRGNVFEVKCMNSTFCNATCFNQDEVQLCTC